MPRTHPIVWKTPLILLILGAIPIALSIVRLVWFATGMDPHAETMDTTHFATMPLPIILHVAFGALFCLLACVQLTPQWRAAAPRLHRTLGYIAIPSGLIAALTAMIMVVIYPIGPFATPTLNVVRFAFGAFMTVAILMALWRIKSRNLSSHRAWMIRAYAVAVAASTQAVFMGTAFATIGDPSPNLATVFLILGFAINSLFAEWWIARR